LPAWRPCFWLYTTLRRAMPNLYSSGESTVQKALCKSGFLCGSAFRSFLPRFGSLNNLTRVRKNSAALPGTGREGTEAIISLLNLPVFFVFFAFSKQT
jgi:hypothetical protein